MLLDPAERVDPARVEIDGQPLEAPDGLLVLWHKPRGFVCSRDSREGPTIYDGLPKRWSRRHPPLTSIGRLDKETTGLLLLTDLGELVHLWTSPRNKIEKTYEVTVEAPLDPGLVGVFASGRLQLEGDTRPCRPARLELTGETTARLVLVEGRYRQVRRMFAAVGLGVVALHRPAFGPFSLGDLPEGAWRLLDPSQTGGS